MPAKREYSKEYHLKFGFPGWVFFHVIFCRIFCTKEIGNRAYRTYFLMKPLFTHHFKISFCSIGMTVIGEFRESQFQSKKMEERRHALFCSLWMMKIQIVIFGTFQNILIDSIWLFDEISEYFVETLGNNAAVFFWRNPYSSRFIRQSLQNNSR